MNLSGTVLAIQYRSEGRDSFAPQGEAIMRTFEITSGLTALGATGLVYLVPDQGPALFSQIVSAMAIAIAIFHLLLNVGSTDGDADAGPALPRDAQRS
jgi:hypothetical protein